MSPFKLLQQLISHLSSLAKNELFPAPLRLISGFMSFAEPHADVLGVTAIINLTEARRPQFKRQQ